MKTLDEIGKDYFPCTCGEIYLSRNLTAPDCPYHAFDWESAMQEYAQQIADKAFEAGFNRAVSIFNRTKTEPDKMEFLNSIFTTP